MRLLSANGLTVMLAGCVAVAEGPTAEIGFLGDGRAAAPVREVSLQGGQVIVAGPPGYCIDTRSVRRGRGGHFVLLASCQNLTGQSDLGVEPAVMTVLSLPLDTRAEQPSADDLAASLAPARVLEKIDGDGVSIVHVAGGGAAGIQGGDPRYLLAAMLINGHITGLALYGAKGSPVAGKAGRRLIMDLAEALREASPVLPVPAPAIAGVASQ